MNNRIIHIISNIKVIGWVTILVFSGILYYCVYSLFSAYYITQMKNSMLSPTELKSPDLLQMDELITELTVFFIMLSLVSVLGILIGRGLVRIKKWASICFHILTIAIAVLLQIGIIYLVIQLYTSHSDKFGMDNMIIKHQTLSWGTLGLLISWLITKANILLFRKDYRIQMT